MQSVPTLQNQPAIEAQTISNVPVRILEIELAQPLPALLAIDEKTAQRYQRARCLVRLHNQPLGIVDVPLDRDELCAREYGHWIWQALQEEILAHLQRDGLPAVTELDPDGLSSSDVPGCIHEREAFFAIAPFMSVIVSTHDRTEQLSACLPALLSQHYPHYEIILVDNAPSTNATAELVQQTYGADPKIRYIREDRPGLSIGLNCGIMAARGEILAFTDDDVVVDAYWLLELARAFSRAENVACVTGLVLPLELETPAQMLFEQFGGFSKGFRRRVYDMRDNRPQEPLYPYTAGRFGTGASMAFRPAFLRKVGGFDPALHCGMDIAAFFQVITQGYTLVYEPAALVYHTHRRSYAELQRQIYTYGVALTAYLTKSILQRPLRLLELLGKVPYGLFFTLSSRSPKNQKKSLQYPEDLTKLELKGMLHGPFVYLRKKRQLSKAVARGTGEK